jgi:excisionase family DNA binding protein
MGIGSAITDSLKKSSSGSGADVPAGASGPPPVMTPSEAAAYLKVAEEDVIAAVEAGDIKAKKIGNAFRISKEALDEFLSS